jgi:hypothetical protein
MAGVRDYPQNKRLFTYIVKSLLSVIPNQMTIINIVLPSEKTGHYIRVF